MPRPSCCAIYAADPAMRAHYDRRHRTFLGLSEALGAFWRDRAASASGHAG